VRSHSQLEQLLHDFNTQSLSKADWTHEAHLIVGLMHVKQYEFYDAVCRMRAGIILLNKHHETANNGEKGYHETLTIFWLTVLSFFVRKNPSMSIVELVNSFLSSPIADRSLPFLFYEREKVLSPFFRSQYIKPKKLDLTDENISAILKKNIK
jgi:hypothetical protein